MVVAKILTMSHMVASIECQMGIFYLMAKLAVQHPGQDHKTIIVNKFAKDLNKH
jgi:hypothetical protein